MNIWHIKVFVFLYSEFVRYTAECNERVIYFIIKILCIVCVCFFVSAVHLLPV